MDFTQLQEDAVKSIQATPMCRKDSEQAALAIRDVVSCDIVTNFILRVLEKKGESTAFLQQLDWGERNSKDKDVEIVAKFEISSHIDLYETFDSIKSSSSKLEIAQLSLQLEDFEEVSKLCYQQYRNSNRSFFEQKYFLAGLYAVLIFLVFGVAMLIMDPSKKSGSKVYAQASIAFGLVLFIIVGVLGFKSWFSLRSKLEYNSAYYKTMIAVYLKCKNILFFENSPFKLRASCSCTGFEVVRLASDPTNRSSSIVKDKVFTIVVEEDTQIECTEVYDKDIYTKVDTKEDC